MYSQNSIVGQEKIPSNTLIHNRYLIQQILGQGGLGRTYLAFDTHRFNESCVLKEFAPFGSGHYDFDKSRDLFKREAKILHQLTHPQIPKFLACFEDRKRLFLVQEFVNGKAYSEILEERQRKGKAFTESEIIRWLASILPILDYIHQLGIIHRDISPDNIMQPQGRKLPVLIDFGVGKLTNLASESAPDRGSFRKPSYVGKMSFVGKIGYAPKEQISMGRCSPSSDIYALGVTALVLLTGKDPIALLNQLSLEWEWQKYARISPKLDRVLSRMTEEKPLRRYQTAREVLKDLHQFFSRHKSTNNSSVAKSSSAKSKPQAKPLASTSQAASQPVISPPESDETIITPPAAASSTSPSSVSPPIAEDTFIVTGVNSAPPTAPQPSANNSSTKQTALDDNTMIISSVNSASTESMLKKPQNSFASEISPEFIRRCQQELGYFMGSAASIVVQEVMDKKQPRFTQELIDALVEYIPDRDRAREFRRRLLSR